MIFPSHTGRFFRSRRQPPPILRANHDSCTLHGSREGSWHVRASILYCESSRSLPPQKKGFPLFPSKVASVALSGALNQFVVEREAEISLSSWKKCASLLLFLVHSSFLGELQNYLQYFPKTKRKTRAFLKSSRKMLIFRFWAIGRGMSPIKRADHLQWWSVRCCCAFSFLFSGAGSTSWSSWGEYWHWAMGGGSSDQGLFRKLLRKCTCRNKIIATICPYTLNTKWS